jgi:hypothetical protein
MNEEIPVTNKQETFVIRALSLIRHSSFGFRHYFFVRHFFHHVAN